MKAQEFYDEQLSNYNLLNLIDPATAKQAMQMMEEYHQAKLNLLTIPVVVQKGTLCDVCGSENTITVSHKGENCDYCNPL